MAKIVIEIPIPIICDKCKKEGGTWVLHSCPFDCEIKDNFEKNCNCCDECEKECHQSV